jgi:hypothetical protein
MLTQVTWRQFLPLQASRTAVRETLCCSAMAWYVIPEARNKRISLTEYSVSFADLCLSPCIDLPFAAISRMLSSFVPRNRCSGHIHGGVSQRWSTPNPSGIGPSISSHTRCVTSLVRFFAETQPYPWVSHEPAHSQHPVSGTGTADSRRPSTESFLCDIPRRHEHEETLPVRMCDRLASFFVPQRMQMASAIAPRHLFMPVIETTVRSPYRFPIESDAGKPRMFEPPIQVRTMAIGHSQCRDGRSIWSVAC